MKTRFGLARSSSVLVLAVPLIGFAAAPAAAKGAEAALALQTEPAQATPAELNDQGLALYAQGDYRRALERFIAVGVLDTDPNVLFNMGRCYERLGDRDAALEKYELFVAKPGGDPKGIERARASIAAIEAAHSREPELVQSEALRASAASGADWLPWLTLGGSAAFLVVGATVYALGAHDHARVTDLPEYGHPDVSAGMTWRQANALVHSGDTKKLAGGLSLALGGALAATTVALFLSQEHAGHDEPALAVKPVVLPRGGRLMFTGTFR